MPLFFEAKSAGDFTNVNQRRKEEKAKMDQLRHTYGPDVRFNPILPSPRYLDVEEILADEGGNPIVAKALFLLDSRLPEEEVKVRYPALWAYLQTGVSFYQLAQRQSLGIKADTVLLNDRAFADAPQLESLSECQFSSATSVNRSMM